MDEAWGGREKWKGAAVESWGAGCPQSSARSNPPLDLANNRLACAFHCLASLGRAHNAHPRLGHATYNAPFGHAAAESPCGRTPAGGAVR